MLELGVWFKKKEMLAIYESSLVKHGKISYILCLKWMLDDIHLVLSKFEHVHRLLSLPMGLLRLINAYFIETAAFPTARLSTSPSARPFHAT